MVTKRFDITGMTCSACSSRIEKVVGKLEGVEGVSVSLLANSMKTEFDSAVTDIGAIISAVEAAGYGAELKENAKTVRPKNTVAEDEIQGLKKRFWISLAFLVPLMYVSMGSMAGLPLPAFLTGHKGAVSFAFLQFLLCLPIVYVNRKYFQVGFKTLFHGAPNMDSLVAIGSGASMIYGIFAIFRMSYGLGIADMELVSLYHMDLYFESAATILTLITLGKYLEARSKGKTGEAISKLMDLSPKTAVIMRGAVETEVPVEQVAAGDIVVIRPGGQIPVDGSIIEGGSSVDESAITGESIPVSKTVGDKVYTATINKGGFFKFRAEKVGDDTTLAQIIRLVEDAAAGKAPISKLADKIAGIFVPAVIIIAVAAAIIWLLLGASFEFALSICITVLVISCPCALGLATPVAIMVGTGKGAENGILIKSGEALETAQGLDTVVLDKTGTITEGRPRVTDIISLNTDETTLLRTAASLEKPSEHPLAEAILEEAETRNMELMPVSDFEAVSGMGVLGSIGGRLYTAGNQAFMEKNGIDITAAAANHMKRLSEQGKTPLLFAENGGLLGIIAAADTVKESSIEAIEGFKSLGIEVTMLTGDNPRTAEAIGRRLGLGSVVAGVLPADKEREISALKQSGKKVAMIGDGVNDAPALAAADVGIAIGAGTDVAIESADIVLIRSDLRDAVTAVKLSRAVLRNIKQNLFWAFFYNCLGIPLAAGVFYGLLGIRLSPMIGAAAMSLSSVCVVTNALRLRRFDPGKSAHAVKNNNASTEAEAEKGETNMITMKIEGMSCAHCSGAVAKALNDIEGVTATVSLEDNAAYVESSGVERKVLVSAVQDAGYTVTAIE